MNAKKEIRIETIRQLLQVLTPENKQRFLLDFAAFVYSAVDLKQKMPDSEIFAMDWTDDGQHDFTGVTIVTNQENNFKIEKCKK